MKEVIIVVFNNFKNDFRVLKEAQTLSNNGYSVKVAALHDDSVMETEKINNIHVRRHNLLSKKFFKHRLFNPLKYIEFIFQFFSENKNFDIIHCNDLITLPLGMISKLWFQKKIKVIYDAHEYEINDKPNESKFSRNLKYVAEKFFIKYADQVITVSDSIAREYKSLYKLSSKPKLVLNCPPFTKTHTQDLFRKEFGIHKNQNIFLYQGGLAKGRGIEMLMNAFITRKDDQDVIVFMGFGPLESEVRKLAANYNTIYFKNAVPFERIMEYTSSADYGIIYYENNCLNHEYCLPNKAFEYLMAQIPIITSNLEELNRLVSDYNVGVTAESNDTLGLLGAIDKIKKMERKELLKNIQKAKATFNWEEQEKVLLQVYKTEGLTIKVNPTLI